MIVLEITDRSDMAKFAKMQRISICHVFRNKQTEYVIS